MVTDDVEVKNMSNKINVKTKTRNITRRQEENIGKITKGLKERHQNDKTYQLFFSELLQLVEN